MLELYALTSNARIAAILLGCLLSVLQATYALYGGYARRLDEDRLVYVAEALLIPQYALMAFLPAAVQIGLENGLLLISAYDGTRYACGALAAALGLAFGGRARRVDLVLAGCLAALSLPCLDRLGAFRWVYATSLLFGLARAAARLLGALRLQQQAITYGSIKRAMDLLPGGMMFYDEKNGFIRLENVQMQCLAHEITGQDAHSGNQFWAQLRDRMDEEGSAVHLVDGNVWRFTRSRVAVGRRRYVQLRAANVTELTHKREVLEQRRAEITKRNEALREMIENIEQIRLAQEAAQAQRRVHDLLGQRISILQRLLQEGASVDAERLLPLMGNLMDALRGESWVPASQLWQEVRASFASIGVQIRQEGALPREEAQARLLVTAIREAATNAVRHGQARTIAVQLHEQAHWLCMRIENDGRLPDHLAQGGGLTGIRQSVEAAGGTMTVETAPRFALVLCLPERSNAHDSCTDRG